MVSYRLLGSAITDATGVASLNYGASGTGELDFIASTSNPVTNTSLVSNTYEVDDCHWIEKGSTVTGLYINSGGTLTLDNGTFTLKKGSGASNFYMNIPKTGLVLDDFKNKTLIAKIDVSQFSATELRMYVMVNTGSWTSATQSIYATGTHEGSLEIPNNATQIRIRFDIYGNENDTVVFNNLRLLWG